MPVRRADWSEPFRRAAGDWHDVHERVVAYFAVGRFRFLRVVAEGEHGAVGRDAVIVVEAILVASLDDLMRAAFHRQFFEIAVPIKEEVRTIARPVGRLESPLREVNDLAITGTYRHSFERAVKNRLA